MARKRPPIRPRKALKPRERKHNTTIRTDPRSTWNPDTVAAICEYLIVGKTFREICELPLMPSYTTIARWEREDPETRKLLARATEAGARWRAEECLEIADEEVFDMVDVARNKLRIDTKLKVNGYWNRRIYGEAKFGYIYDGEEDKNKEGSDALEGETNRKLKAIADRMASMAKHTRGAPRLITKEGKPVIEGKAKEVR